MLQTAVIEAMYSLSLYTVAHH